MSHQTQFSFLSGAKYVQLATTEPLRAERPQEPAPAAQRPTCASRWPRSGARRSRLGRAVSLPSARVSTRRGMAREAPLANADAGGFLKKGLARISLPARSSGRPRTGPLLKPLSPAKKASAARCNAWSAHNRPQCIPCANRTSRPLLSPASVRGFGQRFDDRRSPAALRRRGSRRNGCLDIASGLFSARRRGFPLQQ